MVLWWQRPGVPGGIFAGFWEYPAEQAADSKFAALARSRDNLGAAS
jgi:hypothetical protein